MILLTSDGITSPQLEEEIRKALVPISRRAALVTTASCRYKEKDDNVPVLSALMRKLGLEPECVDVEFQDATFLLAYDVVILMGGNPFYLRKHLKKWNNSLEILIELANRHVLVGISAGSMVLGNTMEFACPIEPDSIKEAGEHVDCSGFGVVPLNIMPHYLAYLTVYEQTNKVLTSYEKETGRKICKINDGEGICVSGAGKKGRYIKNERYTPIVSPKLSNYDNYFFDLYGTLIDIHTEEGDQELWEFMAKYYAYKGAKYGSWELRWRYEALIHEEEELLLNEHPEQIPEPQVERVFLRLYEEKGVCVSRQEAVDAAQVFRSFSLRYVRLYYGAKELLAHLKKKGKKLYVLSNAQQVFTESEMRYLGIYEYFDKVCLSSDYHCKKPDQAYFKNLLEAEGLEPSKTMMIGNSEHDDIRTAKALGMGACYIHSNLSPEGETADCDIVMRAMDLPSLEKILCR